MEKPSTKKPMNVLKTMVFLKNFMEQLSLFTESELQTLEPGSKQWRINKYNELKNLTFDQLEDMQDQIFERYRIKNNWFSDNDYYTSLVIIDIFHYDYFNEFKKRYPKSPMSGYKPQKPFYL